MGMYEDSLEKALLDQKMDSMDREFIIESIKNQLVNPLENIIKRNFLKKLEDTYDKLIKQGGPDEEIDNHRTTIHLEILHKIEDNYNFEVDLDNVKLPKLVKHLYKFFVLEIIDNIQQFLEMYIVDHKQELVKMLDVNTNNVTHNAMKEVFSDSAIAVIATNISEVVNIIAQSPIPFEDFLDTLSEHPDSSGSVMKISDYHEQAFAESEDLYTSIMRPILREDSGYTQILNNIQLKLCKRFATDLEG